MLFSFTSDLYLGSGSHNKKPRIVRIAKSIANIVKPKKELSLWDMRERETLSNAGASVSSFGRSASALFSDHEVKLLLLWAILSPSAAIAYIIWMRYPTLRLLAVILFVVSIFQFAGQWAGMYTLLHKMGLIA